MGKFFNLDSPFVQFMNRVADLMWLNILFLLCCIPVVTVGASVTAMYYVTLKMVRNEESYITKLFFKSFKQNFLQATVIWIIFITAGFLLFVDYRILSGQMGLNIDNGTVRTVMQVLLIAVFIFYVFTITFVFPLLSKFDNTIKNTIKNAFIMSIRHFPATLGSIALLIIVFLLIYYIPIMSMFAFILLFSVSAYISSLMFVRVFDNYIPKTEETQEKDNENDMQVNEEVLSTDKTETDISDTEITATKEM
ncbi:MAG: DUF624 domain-containing protein [Lachnospiraceae bacterium]|nr:DUF624 domain-containing protein [Lachnospiraceae bacterium]